MVANIQIARVTWRDAESDLRAIRTPVFIKEQSVAPEFEWDDMDAGAVHLLAKIGDKPVSCLRIIDYHKIGRMAVLKQWRGMGLGSLLLLEAIEICKQQGSKIITLSAQRHAIGFYLKIGFKVISETYLDAGIPHVDMQLVLCN
jgi:predicted GNAT family N-acyltransferase